MSEARLAGFADDLREASTRAERRELMAEWVTENGLTPLAGGGAPSSEPRLRVVGMDTLFGGFIPGRHPVVRSELVEISVAMEDPSAASVMEAARILVERSRTENVPGRSLLVMFSADSTVGLASRGLWPRSEVFARVALSRDEGTTARYRILSDSSDAIGARPLPGNPGAVAQAEALLHLLLELATPSDTTRRALASEISP